jgi:hypothetical protein
LEQLEEMIGSSIEEILKEKEKESGKNQRRTVIGAVRGRAEDRVVKAEFQDEPRSMNGADFAR